MTARARDVWVSYLRVSTPEQAAKDLSLPAQREAVEEYARRSGQAIAREYLESGCSGIDINRRAFRQMLEDVLKPGSDIGTIVVHHTSRFTRNATQARVVKEQLRKQGVKVVSVCQELNDDPIGQLIEAIVEPALFDLARRLRSQREPTRNPGRAPSPEMLLRGLVRCVKCGASYTLESSGKKVNGEVYHYRYYNCRTACRVGKEACPGGRVPATKLDSAVLEFIVGVVCSGDRCAALLGLQQSGTSKAITDEAFDSVQEAWSTMIRSDSTVARNYLHHLVVQIEVDENRIIVVPKEPYRVMA